jgi:D-alanyl-D-alanine carboxypeptidase
MNKLADKIGCKNTKFTSVTGNTSNEKHRTTASDMAKIMTAFFDDSQLASIVSVGEKKNEIAYRTISEGNGNKTVSNVVLSNKSGTQLAVFAVGGVDKKRNAKDSKALLKYGHENYRTYHALSSGESVGRIKIKGGQKSYTKVYAKEDLYVTLPAEGEESLVKLNVELKENVKAPVKKNSVVGKVQTIEAGMVTSQVDVVVKEELAVGGPWSKLGISDNMMIMAGFVVGLILIVFIVVRARIRRKKRKIAERKRKQRELEAMRIAKERAEKQKRDWPY